MVFPGYSKIQSEHLILLSVLVLSLIIRIWLLDKRWIDPDEGAHLMDAVLILDGKIPSVDFLSRQPVYAYANAGVLRILGVSYISGRLFPMACSILAGVPLYFMALMLFDKKVAFLTAAIYWMLPLESINSVIVQTEPMVILLTCLSLCFVTLFSKNNRKIWVFAAGFFAAMGFYVRQSALIIPLTVLGFLMVHHGWRLREIILSFSIFLTGYISVIILVLFYYARVMGAVEFLTGEMNPFGFLFSAVKELFYLIGISAGPVNASASQAFDVPNKDYALYNTYILDALKLHSFLFIGLLFSIITFCRQLLFNREKKNNKDLHSHWLIYLWFFFLCAAYMYYYYAEAFYINYFREFLPPLIIIFALWIRNSVPDFDRHKKLTPFFLIGLFLSIVLYAAISFYPEILRTGKLVSISLILFTLFYFAGIFESAQRKSVFIFCLVILAALILSSGKLIPCLSGAAFTLLIIGVAFIIPWILLSKKSKLSLKEYTRFMCSFIMLGAFIFSIVYSAGKLTRSYDSNWSTEALKKISAYLKSNTSPTDTVMSGAVIWELDAQRRPFLNISHPLALGAGIPNQDLEKLERELKERPPEIIILDGVTEKTYFGLVKWLKGFLDARYLPVFEAAPARQPVRVYRKKSV